MEQGRSVTVEGKNIGYELQRAPLSRSTSDTPAIRLERGDLEDPDKLRPIAAAAGLTPDAFRDRYDCLAERGIRP